MSTRLKFCGFRTPEAVDAAVACGADALGFNFYAPSPRSVSVAEAEALVARLPLWVDAVGLFVSQPAEVIRATATRLGLRSVQLHGAVSPELCTELSELRVVLALPALPGETERRLEPFAGRIAALLLDAAAAGQHGGTGQQADWSEAARVREAHPELPVILAGGLTPGNVAEAIAAVRPYAVDVASGVERAPGVKDPQLMRAFAEAVRRTA